MPSLFHWPDIFLQRAPNNYRVGFYPFDEMSIRYLPKGKVGLNHPKEREEGLISFGTSFGELVLGAAPGGSMWELPEKAVGGLGPASEES